MIIRLDILTAALLTSLTFLILLGLAACGDDGATSDSGMDGSGPGGEGAACETFTDCRPDLDCVMNICTAGSSGAVGDACIYTARCMEGLYCSDPRTCQPEGDGSRFSPCSTSGDCVLLLVCSLQGDGSLRCVDAGDGDIGPPADACTVAADCQAGLFCVDGTCAAESGGLSDGGMDGGDGGRNDATLGGPCEDDTNCDDMSMCTVDQCLGMRCLYTIVDSDEDGYASTIIPGGCGRDCADMDPAVNPDHTAFETARHMGNPPLQPMTFDWNCDGTEEMQWTATVPDCDRIDGTCTAGEGWGGLTPPCGTTENWMRCTGPSAGCLLQVVEARTQSCR